MRYLLFAVLLSCFVATTKAQSANPYLTLKYDSLVFYDYEGGKGMPDLIDKQGKLSNTVVKRVAIDATTAKEFNKRLGLRAAYGQPKAFCFDPHLGAVYYRQGRAVATVLICLECNVLKASEHLSAQEQGFDIGGEEKTGIYTGGGMSRSFRKYVDSLLKKYHFSHQLDPRGNAMDGYK